MNVRERQDSGKLEEGCTTAFWSVINASTLLDGRPASEVISRWIGKDTNFEIVNK